MACEGRTLRAEHAPEFAKGDSAEAGIMPTVGDWVAVAVPPEHDMGVIHEVLPRRNAFARWRGGRRGEFQTLAANLDGVIVVAALGTEDSAACAHRPLGRAGTRLRRASERGAHEGRPQADGRGP